MSLEQIISKLELIEQQARLTMADPRGPHVIEQQRLIAGLARQLRVRLRDQLRGGNRATAPDRAAGGHAAEAGEPVAM